MPKPPKPDHDVAAVVARIKAHRAAQEECPMFPNGGGGGDGFVREEPPLPRLPGPGDLRGFVRLVGELRTMQRRYFRTRSSADLDRAKAMEAAVDAWLRDYDRQGRLDFGE